MAATRAKSCKTLIHRACYKVIFALAKQQLFFKNRHERINKAPERTVSAVHC